MPRSIRGTLQLWYGATLTVAIGSLVAVMDYRLRQTELQRIDADLEGAAQTLLAGPDFSEDPAHDVRDPSRPEEQEWARRMGLDYNGTGVFSDVWWRTVPANAMRRLQQADEQPDYVVWSASGRILRASGAEPSVPTDPAGTAMIAAAVARIGHASFLTRGDRREVVVAEAGRYPMRVLVGKSIEPELATLARYRLGVAGTGAVILLVGLAGGWLLIGRALQPIDGISATARAISGSDLSRRISVPVRTDRTLLLRVLTNLLSNAIHYNREGGSIRIALRAEAGTAVIEVADTGTGIAPEDQPRVFERFFRADKARSASLGGAGLGLSICHGIVTCLGGTIAFNSQPGTGTTFVVRLPIAPAAGPGNG